MTDFEVFIKKNKLKKKEVAEFIGVSSAFITQLTQGVRDVPPDKLALIKANISWDTTMFDDEKLIKPEMLKDEKPKYNEAFFLENANIMMIPVVSQYAYAGYTHGYADTEYIESLPKMPFYADHEAKGNYIGFEVKGESMNNGSENSIIEGDMLACREIKQDLWKYKLHLNKWFFVVVHKTEGILVKQITDHNLETGIITIHSLNPFYEDREINLNDVAQLFNVVQILRTPRL